MDRRDFLRVGVGGASGFLALAGDAGASILGMPEGRPRPIPLPDMGAYIECLDAGMESISRWSPSRAFPAYGGDRQAVDNLARKSLRTLYLTAMFSDLPEEGQRHTEVQSRVFDAMPEMDQATAGMAAFLATRSPEDLEGARVALRSPVNPAMEIFDALDREGAALGLSPQRRLQTRMMMTQANWRLRNQPPSLVIAETLEKVEKMVATDVSLEARTDWIAGRAGEQLFWQQANGATTAGDATEGESEEDGDHRSKRERRLASGGRIMGIGLVVGGLGAAGTAAGAFPLVFVATVGAIMILVGLIMLLIGLATPGEPKSAP